LGKTNDGKCNIQNKTLNMTNMINDVQSSMASVNNSCEHQIKQINSVVSYIKSMSEDTKLSETGSAQNIKLSKKLIDELNEIKVNINL
jgi:methyl-accepting chemotaxis protein